MAIDKSKWNTNIKVSKKTIDEIKKMGMSKALKTAAFFAVLNLTHRSEKKKKSQ